MTCLCIGRFAEDGWIRFPDHPDPPIIRLFFCFFLFRIFFLCVCSSFLFPLNPFLRFGKYLALPASF